jgi:hypothetical protein
LTPTAMDGSPLKAADAHALVEDLISTVRHAFLASPPPSLRFVGQTSGRKAAFDDYLVQIAAVAGYKLATFDRALTRRWPDHAFLIQ